jgi:hypothetical protein
MTSFFAKALHFSSRGLLSQLIALSLLPPAMAQSDAPFIAEHPAQGAMGGQTAQPRKPEVHLATPSRPDPKEIPLPAVKTLMTPMPDVDQLPIRPEMPDVLTLDNGRKVKTERQWAQRREELKRILEWYAVGQAPPPPGNVKGKEISSELLLCGKVKYRLVHLTFGPNESLGMDIGVFTSVGNRSVPTLISPSGTPPGATPLPRLS